MDAYTRWALIRGFIIMALFAVAIWFILPARMTGVWRYSHRFDVPSSQVRWNPKPSDCDYLRSPMGDKACHFKISVEGYNAVGQIVGGEEAPLYQKDPGTGKSNISFDDGRTWYPVGRDTDLTVTHVVINWVRVND
jgi:hypothetical protein